MHPRRVAARIRVRVGRVRVSYSAFGCVRACGIVRVVCGEAHKPPHYPSGHIPPAALAGRGRALLAGYSGYSPQPAIAYSTVERCGATQSTHPFLRLHTGGAGYSEYSPLPAIAYWWSRVRPLLFRQLTLTIGCAARITPSPCAPYPPLPCAARHWRHGRTQQRLQLRDGVRHDQPVDDA